VCFLWTPAGLPLSSPYPPYSTRFDPGGGIFSPLSEIIISPGPNALGFRPANMLELDFFPRKCKGGKIRFKALKRGFQKGGKIPKPAEKIHFSGEIIPEAPFSADFACLKSRPFYPSVGKFGAPTGRLFPSWPVARR
jgi:hypothetical protein